MFSLRKRHDERRGTIERLYGVIVAQARAPVFYADLGVPDTLEGRFDLIVLHLHLVNRRLGRAEARGRELGQELLDFFFEDMDASLREIGIGDLSVPKKMRTLGEAYLGRAAAYDGALAAKDRDQLAAAIARNVYAGASAAGALRLAHYVLSMESALEHAPDAQVVAGAIIFPDPVEAIDHVR